MFLDFIFKKKENNLGLDIGNHLIKFVIADSKWTDNDRVLSSAKVNFVGNIRIDNLDDPNVIQETIIKFLDENKIDRALTKTIACISGPNVIVRTIEETQRSKKDLEKDKEEIVSKYIPYGIDKAKYDLIVLNQSLPYDQSKMELLLISLLLEEVVIVEDIIKNSNLQKVAVEFDLLGAWRLLEGINYKGNFNSTVNMLIDFGAVSTKISVFQEGKMKLLRNLKIGADDLIKRMVEVLAVSKEELLNSFEELSIDDAKYQNIFIKHFESIIKEIKRTISTYKSRYSVDFNEIYIIGGVSKIKNLDNYLKREIEFNVEKINYEYLKNVIKVEKKYENEFKENIAIYVNALGLALGHGQQRKT
ncbi:MAG: pilus assembly protein PilM [bacterium]|nr:pilus assembly protein PilM [bacterium]